MTYAMITVAGVSSRFNQKVEKPILKCLYHTGNEKKTLLYSNLSKCKNCDGVIVVGGYQFEKLEQYIEKYKNDFPFGIEMVYNPYYATYGSGYSLKLGLQKCIEKEKDADIVMIEGDLQFDSETFDNLIEGTKSFITINVEPICSNKAVALYYNEKGEWKYLYNTKHGLFQIPEPFSAIYNSGQVWKFANYEVIQKVMKQMPEQEWFGTNLCFIECYFNQLTKEEMEIVRFQKWLNCNTKEDYEKCQAYL